MKKKSLFIAVLALACACLSCNKEKELVQEPAEYLLTAGTESTGNDTKTYIADGNLGKEIRWNEKDQISVFSEHSNTYTYTLKEGAKTTSAVFSTQTKPDFKSDSKYTAYYPASVVSDGNGRTFTWPSEQTRELSNAEKVALPLLAEGDIDNGAPSNATFNCLGGILDVQLKVPANGVPGYLRKVVITTDQKISGKFTLQTVTEHVKDSQGNSTSETVEKKYAVIANDGLNTITYTLEGSDGKGLYIPSGEAIERKLMFAMPVSPAGGYTSFQVDFYDEHDTRISGAKSKNPLVIERGMITNANIPFSHKYAPGLTMNDPVGKIGTLYGVEAIVIEVGGYKRALALHNVGYTEENPRGTKFAFDANWNPTPSLDLKNGWRLPYVEEWDAIASNYGGVQELGIQADCFYLYIEGQVVELPFMNTTSYPCQNHGCGYIIQPNLGYYYMTSQRDVTYLDESYVRAIRELPFYPAIDPEHEITADDPVGSIGMLHGRQAVVMNLRGYKVALATQNIGASTPEDPGSPFEFTAGTHGWNYDQLYLTNGWRVPTSQEWKELIGDMFVKDDNNKTRNWIFSDQSKITLPSKVHVSSETNYVLDGDELDQFGSTEANVYARPIYSLNPITKDSSEGTVGVVDGRECVVVSDEDENRFLITVNNPGPAEGGFGANGHNDANDFNCYKHGAYRTREDAKNNSDNGYYGKGWRISSLKELHGVTEYNNHYTRSWNDSEKRLEVKITNSYTWYLYAGGYIKPAVSTGTALETEKCYYQYTDSDGGGYLQAYFDSYETQGYSIYFSEYNVDTKEYKYNFCLTHDMPN